MPCLNRETIELHSVSIGLMGTAERCTNLQTFMTIIWYFVNICLTSGSSMLLWSYHHSSRRCFQPPCLDFVAVNFFNLLGFFGSKSSSVFYIFLASHSKVLRNMLPLQYINKEYYYFLPRHTFSLNLDHKVLLFAACVSWRLQSASCHSYSL